MTSEMLINAPMFEKRTIAELSIDEMESINGGATPAALAAASSSYCAGVAIAAGVFVVGAIVGYFS
jgi:lactobin A/cerein 7B family class IIb bacteriocin